MSHERDDRKSTDSVDEGLTFATEMEPPPGLEDRIVADLRARQLLRPDTPARADSRSRALLWPLAAAVLLAAGFLGGRMTSPVPAESPVLTGRATDLYAVLLYETETYDAPSPAEAGERYGEYSQWVAEARRRGQFVTGQDLEVQHGWLLRPTESEPAIEDATSVEASAPLSGVFFLQADDPDRVLELARTLPHLRHGGTVLVQKTLPTAEPPGGR